MEHLDCGTLWEVGRSCGRLSLDSPSVEDLDALWLIELGLRTCAAVSKLSLEVVGVEEIGEAGHRFLLGRDGTEQADCDESYHGSRRFHGLYYEMLTKCKMRRKRPNTANLVGRRFVVTVADLF